MFSRITRPRQTSVDVGTGTGDVTEKDVAPEKEGFLRKQGGSEVPVSPDGIHSLWLRRRLRSLEVGWARAPVPSLTSSIEAGVNFFYSTRYFKLQVLEERPPPTTAKL